jgi:hypothetical protein
VRVAKPGTPANTTGVIRVYYSPTDAQVIVLKTVLKLTLK